MFTLCYYATIILLLNVYYAAINLSCYYDNVMLLIAAFTISWAYTNNIPDTSSY